MNKIYKLVWSRTKNMYVAVCEFAKSHTKAPASHARVSNSRSFIRTVAACVLSTFFSFGNMIPNVYAFEPSIWTASQLEKLGNGTLVPFNVYNESERNSFYYFNETGKLVFCSDVDMGTTTGSQTYTKAYTLDASALGLNSGITYTAGNGITISEDTISAKAGTNVTVNGNGISVTGNGTVASGNTGLIDGGKLYAEVRPSDNGNYEEKFSTLL